LVVVFFVVVLFFLLMMQVLDLGVCSYAARLALRQRDNTVTSRFAPQQGHKGRKTLIFPGFSDLSSFSDNSRKEAADGLEVERRTR
jgi:hypothetical protein